MRKLLFIVNNPAFFVSHRLEIGRAAVNAGYQVFLLYPHGDAIEQIESTGIEVQRTSIDRGNHSWLAQLRFMYAVWGYCRRIKPDICHLITLKTFLVGGVAAKLANVPRLIGSVSGLGYLLFQFVSQNYALLVQGFSCYTHMLISVYERP